ncbi:MAG: mandelate racemase/muconate lactonizing enzyme family protein [Thermoleophilia bacterium]|nr:mandelate racemase/muconate lactonizing enzyme family protein [Thermoleophilia bacterium]
MTTIAAVDVLVVGAPAGDDRVIDSTLDTALVRVTSEDGLTGFGEAGARSAAVRAFIEERGSWAWDRSIHGLLVGRDCSDPRALWRELYEGTRWSGRAGLGHVALGGVDMALWDLAGKAAGLPVWRLLGGEREDPIVPYVTMYRGSTPLRETIADSIDLLDRARELGFRAAKIEALVDTTADEDEIVELVRAVRGHAGPDFTLLCDVGYRWRDAEEAIRCARRLDGFDLFLLEAPLLPDDLDGYRRLCEAVRTPIAGAELVTSYAECTGLLEAGVPILQPGCNRLGVTETDRVARLAGTRGRRVVPFGWCATALGVGALLNVAQANGSVALVEYAPPALYPEAVLRNELAGPEPRLRDGAFEPPAAAGLGVEVDAEALARLTRR